MTQPRPENDPVWDEIRQGPITSSRQEIQERDPDDLVTSFAKEWYVALKSLHKCVQILDVLVDKYNITTSTQLEELPTEIYVLYTCGNQILTAASALYGDRSIIAILDKIRKDWGSITAYAQAPIAEQLAWQNSLISGSQFYFQQALEMLARINDDDEAPS